MLDYGAGCGISSIALKEWLLPGGRFEASFDAVEASPVLRRMGMEALPDALWRSNFPARRERYDVVLASHAMAETGTAQGMKAALNKLWKGLKPGRPTRVIDRWRNKQARIVLGGDGQWGCGMLLSSALTEAQH